MRRHLDLAGLPVLTALTGVCLALLALRVRLAGEPAHGFLIWNVFLAWLPSAFGWAALRAHSLGSRLTAVAFGAAWLAFFPNAPYLVTDLVHLEAEPRARLLYDALLIGALGLLGLLLGAAALRPMHRRIDERFGALGSVPLLVVMGLLTGFGVYLGRVRRWNSWAVLEDPVPLLTDVWMRLSDPLAHRGTLAVTVGFGGFFVLSYLLAVGLRPTRVPARPTRR